MVMAYNFNTQPQYQQQQAANNNMPQFQQQNIQPLFPQPQGNVYNINSTLEVANVPVSGGMSVALCLNEGFMYIKSLQNGNPLFWAYKITPYDNSVPLQQQEEQTKDNNNNEIIEQFKKYDNRFQSIEGKVFEIQNILKQKLEPNQNEKGVEWKL